MGALTYFPQTEIARTPADLGMSHRELHFATSDGERLYGWWITCERTPVNGHILMCHGNGGNIGDRLIDADLLRGAAFNVLLFDYRGYGRSTGRPDEQGTYRDAVAARQTLLRQPECDSARVIYLGESLGGAIALALAVQAPPMGLILQSTFTSLRAVARHHYPVIPSAVVPDAYPSIRRIARVRAPLLSLHGDRDEVVPLSEGRALFEAAPEPKRMHVFEGLGHSDLVTAGTEYARVIKEWAEDLAANDVGGGPGGERCQSSSDIRN
jgi:pimeloyl-ACP methyl ester carboxylesterase